MSKEKLIDDLANALAEKSMVFFDSTPEAYKLRAKLSYKRGFIDGCDYTNSDLEKIIKEVLKRAGERAYHEALNDSGFSLLPSDYEKTVLETKFDDLLKS